MSDAFDPFRAASSLLGDLPAKSGPRMHYHDRCAAFAALQIGFSAPVVAMAFGTTRQSINHLASCILPHEQGDKPRYEDVGREWVSLGDTAFIKRYYTEAIHERMLRVKHKVLRAADDRSMRGPQHERSEKAHNRFGTFFAADSWWRIDWTLGNGHENGQGEGGMGWRFCQCEQDGTKSEHPHYQGREVLGGNPYGEVTNLPFRTSALAHKAVLTAFT